MDNALKLAKILFFLASAFLSLSVAAGVQALAHRAEATVTDLDRVILSVGGTAAEVRKTSKATAAAADEQRRYWREISQRGIAVLGDVDRSAASLAALLGDTDRSLNEDCDGSSLGSHGTILVPWERPADSSLVPRSPRQENSVVATPAAPPCRLGVLPEAAETLISLQGASNSLAATSAQGTAALQNASKLLGDPSLLETEKNLASVSAHSDALMADAQDSMHRIDLRVQELTTPKGTVRVLAGGVWDLFKASLSGLVEILK